MVRTSFSSNCVSLIAQQPVILAFFYAISVTTNSLKRYSDKSFKRISHMVHEEVIVKKYEGRGSVVGSV